MESGTEEGERAGADAALPQHLFLRGDEPEVDEFCLTADQVMEMLGIKRSRLTQISGRELRVARLRVGRYIRPMYRAEDVAAYQQWTRPTASYKASSAALAQTGEEISQTLEALLEDHLATLPKAAAELKAEVQIFREAVLYHLSHNRVLADRAEVRLRDQAGESWQRCQRSLLDLKGAGDKIALQLAELRLAGEALYLKEEMAQGMLRTLTAEMTAIKGVLRELKEESLSEERPALPVKVSFHPRGRLQQTRFR